MGIFMVMVVPIVDTFVSTSARVTSTYDGFDQVLPVGTIIQQYVRAAVEPAPALPSTGTGSYPTPVPVPAFGEATFQNSSGTTVAYTSATQEALSPLTGCSISFYANVPPPPASSSSNGPALITATVAPASSSTVGAPCTSAAPASAVWVVTVTETLPTSGTCPISQNGTPPSPPTTCAYSSSATKYPVTVDDVVNDLDSASAGYTPIFSYAFVSPFPPQTGVTPTETPVATSALATDFGSCTESACDAAAINQVGTDIQVRLPHGQETEDSTSVYTLSPISNEYLLSVG